VRIPVSSSPFLMRMLSSLTSIELLPFSILILGMIREKIYLPDQSGFGLIMHGCGNLSSS
jgi:hypothetical protein